MDYLAVIQVSNEAISLKELSIYLTVFMLIIILIVLSTKLWSRLKSDNSIYYEEKGAINLRVEKVPDLRIATSHCKDFKIDFYKNYMILSYANPFGSVKTFKCELVGDKIENPYMFTLTEVEFKKFCFHLKPGTISITKRAIRFNYNKSVKGKLIYYKKEV